MLPRNLRTVLVIVVLLVFLGWAISVSIGMWTSVDAVMTGHAWVALVLGVFFSCLVGFGLMALLFFSSRRGYDEPPTFEPRDENDTGDET